MPYLDLPKIKQIIPYDDILSGKFIIDFERAAAQMDTTGLVYRSLLFLQEQGVQFGERLALAQFGAGFESLHKC